MKETDNTILKYCKHYGKVKYETIFSGYEEKWIELSLHDKESLNDLIQYYIRSGLEHFCEYDDTPIGIKAILWNRYEHHDFAPTLEGFADWYKRQYLGFEFFFYFDGESETPAKYDCTKEQILWRAEKMIYVEMAHLLHSENPCKEIAHYIAGYVGKCNPYEQREILTAYLENVPSLKDEILNIYG